MFIVIADISHCIRVSYSVFLQWIVLWGYMARFPSIYVAWLGLINALKRSLIAALGHMGTRAIKSI